MNHLITFIILLTICVICVYATNFENVADNSTEIEATNNLENVEEGRKRKVGHYFYHPYHHGWYALSILYWVKVKLIIIAFFVGTAFVWGINHVAKYFRPCPGEGHIHYGHYRSLEDPVVIKFLQSIK